MPTIPQRELRNNISEVLRRAERGERFTITVAGREVAELGPATREPRGRSVSELWELLARTPVDPGWAADLQRMRDDDLANSRDPWAD